MDTTTLKEAAQAVIRIIEENMRIKRESFVVGIGKDNVVVYLFTGRKKDLKAIPKKLGCWPVKVTLMGPNDRPVLGSAR